MKNFVYIKFTIVFVLLFLIVSNQSLAKKPGTEKLDQSTGIPYGAGVSHYEPFSSSTRTQIRDLGIGPYDVIPSGQTAITSLVVSEKGHIYGGTTGEVANLFVFMPEHNFVLPLGIIPEEESIYHAMVWGADNTLYFGTTKNPNTLYYPDESIARGPNYFYRSVTIQIQDAYQKYDGGHIYQYVPEKIKKSTTFFQPKFRIDKPCPVVDLGIPVPHEGIYTLIQDQDSDLLYGITYPGSYFFSFDMKTKRSKIITRFISSMPTGQEVPMMSKALVQDKEGAIYANTYHGHLIQYSPETGVIDTLNVQIPGMKGREVFNCIECAQVHPNGKIYGGTTDGYLFCFNPETEVMLNYGKPLMESQIRAMSIGLNGHIYGVGGEDRGVARLFEFNINTCSFKDLGIPEVSYVPYFEWKGLVFDAMVTGKEGSLYLGNSEYRSKLFIYNP